MSEETQENSLRLNIPGLVHISKDINRSIQTVNNARLGKSLVLKTKWEKLNRNLMGGLLAGKMYVIAGRPGVGKSAFSNQMLFDLVDANPNQKLIILYWSFEMPGEEQILRIGSKDSGISTFDLMSVDENKRLPKDSFDHYINTVRKYKDYPVYFCSIPQHPSQMQEINEKVFQEYPNRTIVNLIDHSRLVAGNNDNELVKLNTLSKTMMFIQSKLHSITILLSQLNRNIEQEHRSKQQYQPMLSDLYGSDSIGQDAHVVMMLQRPYDLYNITEPYCDENPKGLLACHIEKNRGGRLGLIPFEADLANFSIKERT